MMKNVWSGKTGGMATRTLFEACLQWLLNIPAFANTIHLLAQNKHLSRPSLAKSRPYLNERLLFRMKKAMKKPHAMLLRIGRQA